MLKRISASLLVLLLLSSCLPAQAIAIESSDGISGSDVQEEHVAEQESELSYEQDAASLPPSEHFSIAEDTAAMESAESALGETASSEGSIQETGTPENDTDGGSAFLLSDDPDAELASETEGANSCGESLSWTYDESSKTLTITGTGAMTNYTSASSVPWYAYMSTMEAVVISDGATSIGAYAFYGAAALQSVSVPDGIESIGKYAFYKCSALEEVALPNSIASLGYRCFASCASLTRINIPESWNSCPSYSSTVNTDYCGHIFQDCTSLTSVVVPEGMTALPNFAFAYCNTLVSVTLPGTLTSLSNQAFYHCDALTSMEIPDGVTPIGKSAFCYCGALEEVEIPDGVTELALFAFYECKSLEDVQLPDSITSIGFNCFYNCSSLSSINIPKDWTETPSSSTSGTISTDYCGHIFQGCTNLKTLTIPEGLTIPSYGLCYSDYLETVNLPSSATEIKNHTFYGCSRLKNIAIPDTVTYIGKSAFNSCDALEHIDIPDGITEIVSYTFDGCESLVKIDIPDTVTKIGAYAFNECKSLTSVVIPDSVTGIGYRAFASCVNLTDVTLSANWNECISNSTSGTISTDYCGHIFQGCTNLKTLTIPEGLTIPSYGLCYSDYLETVNLPSSATEIKNHTFYGCSRLKNIAIPDTVTYIGKSAFNSCDALEHIDIPDGITEIVSYTFDGCESLVKIDIPDTVTKIGAYAFNECKSLASVVIPDSVTGIGYRAFANCVNLTDVTLSANWNACISSSTSGTVGTSYCGGIFYGCSSLLTVTVPDGVTTLPDYAFANCTNLKSVKLPNSLTAIPAYAFYGCSELVLIQVPENVTSISKYAFYNCSSVKIINISDAVQTVERYAFYNCSSSAAVNYVGDSSAWDSISLDQNGNSALTGAVPNFNCTYDETFGVIRPTSLGNCFYSSPEEVSYTNFYGFTGAYSGSSSNHVLIDVNDAFFGKNAYDTAVSIPKDSFITLRFPKIVYFQTDSILFLKTEGVVYEKADIYAVTESGELQFICTAVEDSNDQLHKIPLPNLGVGITGLKIVGKDLDGASPGFDVVDLYLLTHETSMDSDFNSKTTVSMTRDSKTYNLLKEEQAFEQGTDEYVTLIVNPDWKNYDPGYISVTQGGRTVLQNKGGTFVDANPGDLFSPLESVYVSLIDSDGNIVESLKLKLKINVKPSSRLTASANEMSVTIYENKKSSSSRTDDYILSEGTKVVADGVEYTTDKHGVAVIPTLSSGSITVSKENFITRTITAEQLERSKKVYLQKAADGNPVVSAVWAGNTDVLNQNYAVDLLSDQSITLTVEVDWGDSSYGSIALMQDARTVLFNGTSLSTVLSEHFDVSETIFIVAKAADGSYTKKGLKFEVGDASGTPAWLNGLSFNLGDSLSFTLPDDVTPSWMAGQKISTGISSIIPLTVSVENGKVYVAIGADIVGYEKNMTSSATDKTANLAIKRETTTFIKALKDTGVFDNKDLESSVKKLKDFKSRFKHILKYPKGTFGYEAQFTILGFAEGYYAPDATSITDITWLDSGLILNPKVGASLKYPLFIPFTYLEGSVEADILAQFNLYVQKQAKSFMPDGQLSGDISLMLGLLAGVKGILYGSGGVKGQLSPMWKFNYGSTPDYFKLTASGMWYGKFGFLFWDVSRDSDPWYEEVWVEYPKTQKALPASLMSTGGIDIYDASNYVRKDLSYLDGASDFLGCGASGNAALLSLSPGSSWLTAEPLKTNIYRQSTPQFVQFGDETGLAVWQDAADSGMNSLCLYYSYFNGSAWSAPALVCDDGTVDNAPYLALIDDTAYLVWQNATKQFSDDDTMESIAPYFDIAFAEFDAEAGFDTRIISCDGLDMMPTICGSSEAVYVVWSKNSANDWFSTDGTDSICHCEYTSGAVSDIVTDYEGLRSLNSIAADYDGKLHIAYCMDMDGDPSTYDDVRVYEDGSRVTTADELESYPQYHDGTLYWNSLGTVSWAGGAAQQTALGAANYQIVHGGEETALIYTSSNGLSSTLNASYLNPETQQWCEPVELTDGSTFIGAFSASMSENGTLTVLVNSQDVVGSYEDAEPYGASTLSLITLEPYCDLSMGELMYADDAYNAGNAMEFCFDLTNSGSQTVRSAVITLSDNQGTVLSSITMDDVIVPGQTITASTYFNIDASATGQNIVIAVAPDEWTDVNDRDNSRSAALAFEDLSVEQASWGMQADGTTTLSANIVNYGYYERSNIVVELREGSADGTLLDTASIASLGVLSLDTVTFDLENQNSDVYFISIRDSGDIFTANDRDYAAVLPAGTEYVTIDSVSASSAQLCLENDQAGKCIVAVYDADGKMLTRGMTDVTANAGEVTVSYAAFACDGRYTVKVFLVDASLTPVCTAVEKEL